MNVHLLLCHYLMVSNIVCTYFLDKVIFEMNHMISGVPVVMLLFFRFTGPEIYEINCFLLANYIVCMISMLWNNLELKMNLKFNEK